ncbi:hypothetical protein KIL84_020480 [Mauremys mutica]|uniref:Uncharacterized protein n=1 Tax=Mauremys mutica TaxID=74926 RepID=A0A9D3XYG7_9SAUR|nr:hypothetical protein KIL84_020480 [Mauremys mutica]
MRHNRCFINGTTFSSKQRRGAPGPAGAPCPRAVLGAGRKRPSSRACWGWAVRRLGYTPLWGPSHPALDPLPGGSWALQQGPAPRLLSAGRGGLSQASRAALKPPSAMEAVWIGPTPKLV